MLDQVTYLPNGIVETTYNLNKETLVVVSIEANVHTEHTFYFNIYIFLHSYHKSLN